MARAPRAYLAAAAVALALAACRKQEPPGTLAFDAPAQAALKAPLRLSVSADPGGEASFTADMTHPGMVPVVVKASETAPGRYEGELSWTMAGDWVVLFSARWPDGRRAEGRAPVRVAP